MLVYAVVKLFWSNNNNTQDEKFIESNNSLHAKRYVNECTRCVICHGESRQNY